MALEINDIVVSTTATKAGKLVPKVNQMGVDPTVNDDSSAGWDMGDYWMNTVTDDMFVCCDASVGAAVWKKTTESIPAGADIASVSVTRTTVFNIPNGTPSNVTFDNEEIENDPSVIEHDNTNTERIYLYESSHHFGVINFELENASAQDRVITIELYKNNTTLLSSISVKVDKSSTEHVTRSLILPPLTAGDYISIRLGADGISCTLKTNNRAIVLQLKGATGPQGPQGPAGVDGALVHLGQWTTATSYAVGDGVQNNGSSYTCYTAHTSSASDEPGVGGSWTTYWRLMAAKGATGGGGYFYVDRTRDNGSAQSNTTTSYEAEGSFVIDGATETISEAIFNCYTQSTSMDARLYDVTNSQELCVVNTTSSDVNNIVSTTTINNHPTGKAKIEIQIKKNGGGGDCFIFGAGVKL